ncbi:nucleoside deaminase [Microbacterium sp. P07]|uniref:nucleoside deaminase n=1 Tax=Microbacterium sp. P07 TaxID=3366952 RepID=UPI003746592E
MTDPERSTDLAHLAHALRLAQAARDRGDHPFGAIVVTPGGAIVEGMNSVLTEGDPTGHAETNLVRAAGRALESVELAASTLFTSTEPCAMCAGAIYWSGIGRVVYALGEDDLIEMVREQEGVPTMALPCREVFARGGRAIEVVGPVEVDGSREVHAGFWN